MVAKCMSEREHSVLLCLGFSLRVDLGFMTAQELLSIFSPLVEAGSLEGAGIR